MLNPVAKPSGKKTGQPKLPTLIELPCGCRYSRAANQMTHLCPIADRLYRAILETGPYLPQDEDNPRTAAYSEHITSQLQSEEF